MKDETQGVRGGEGGDRTAWAAGVHHLALGARDVEGLACFYTDVFGLEHVMTHHDEAGAVRSIWLRLGVESVLMIERTALAQRPRVAGVDAGWFLLALRAPGTLEEAEAHLAARGVAVESRTGWTLYVRDLEGNRVAVSAYPLPHA